MQISFTCSLGFFVTLYKKARSSIARPVSVLSGRCISKKERETERKGSGIKREESVRASWRERVGERVCVCESHKVTYARPHTNFGSTASSNGGYWCDFRSFACLNVCTPSTKIMTIENSLAASSRIFVFNRCAIHTAFYFPHLKVIFPRTLHTTSNNKKVISPIALSQTKQHNLTIPLSKTPLDGNV